MRYTDWPTEFTRGAPAEEGCFVCIVDRSPVSSRRYELEIVDIENLDTECARELGTSPGLSVVTDEGCAYTLDEYEIVGYQRLCDSSVDVTATDGFRGVDSYLKLNEAGIQFYLDCYRRELEKLRVLAWSDKEDPPTPPAMPMIPKFSRSFFVEADE